MRDLKKKRTEEEAKLIKEVQSFMDEVNSNPEVANLTAPPEMQEKVFAKIHELEEAKAKTKQEEERSAQEQELIRLGKLYKRKRKARKYWVLAAAVVCLLAFGMTSMGVPKKLFDRRKSALWGRPQVNVDSQDENVTPPMTSSEEEVYQEIEEKFGFKPVRLDYLPKDVELLETEINDEMQSALLVYGQGEKAKIVYYIRPNYRSSSIGKDVEDDLIREYSMENEYTTIHIREFSVEKEESRWEIQFEYLDVSYFMIICDTTESEVHEIVENLYFL